MDADVGPNVSSDAGNFFQSDRDLEIERAREQKKADSLAKNAPGNPIITSSKVLALTLTETQPDCAYVAESGHVARKIDLKTGKSINVFKGHSGPVTSIAVVSDQNGGEAFIVTGSWDTTVRKWDAKTASHLSTFTGHADFVKKVRVYGQKLYSASSDSTIRQWDLETGECIAVFKDHSRAVEDIVLSEDGNYLYSASSDTTIKKWDTKTGKLIATLIGHLTSVYALVISEGSLWSASADRTAKRWDLETNQPDSSFEHPDFVRSIEVLPGGAHIVTGSRDENVRIWDVATEKCVKIIGGHFGEVSGIQRQGSTLFTASLDGTIRRWTITERDLKPGNSEALSGSVATPRKEVQEKPVKKSAVTLTEEEERELAELMGEDEND